ncbi:hypothetical protein ACF1AO_19010 [Streptomyces longwoodensis]|uniref:hypothetical protein n=1 Tax=Streptomyces longwoodensis TaxID=68231 RepID=UPI0037003745
MGYWGCLVVVRHRQQLGELAAFTDGVHMELLQERADDWRLWSLEGQTSLDEESLIELVDVTGHPVLAGFVMDSDCLVLEGRTKDQETWRACLDRAAMSAYMAEDGQSVEDWFLGPEEAAERAVAWARAAGLTPVPKAIADVLSKRSDPFVEGLFQELLDGLGIEL